MSKEIKTAMTDYEKFINLLKEMDIEYIEKTVDILHAYISGEILAKNAKIIYLEEGKKKITGYFDFYTCIEFTNKGEFIQIGAWE